MKSQLGLFLFILYLTRVTEGVFGNERAPHYRLRIIKRETQGVIGANEGEQVKKPLPETNPLPTGNQNVAKIPEVPKPALSKAPVTNGNANIIPMHNMSNIIAPSINLNSTVTNATTTNVTNSQTAATPEINLNNPGVLKRAVIVFGTFTLLAVLYYIFYKRKSNKNESNNSNSNDNNQFRYGVLQSDDRRDNLELSRIPLTIESDEDDDEDLEVFDIEERRKNLSYVNLQTRDIDVIKPQDDHKDNEEDNLLLDIDDSLPDTSMDWMHSSSKSIL